MFRELPAVTLRSGETVEAGVVIAPDAAWAAAVEKLLSHKPPPWRRQNHGVLTHDIPELEARFYILHRAGEPFCNIMIAERHGVGLLGHVFTVEADRKQGAASELMRRAMDDVRRRDTRWLALGTEPDTHPFRLYERFGFVGIEPGSGYMDWCAGDREAFETEFFAPGPTRIEPIDWRHWPSSAPLMMRRGPGVIRCAPLRIRQRMSTEGPLLETLPDTPNDANDRSEDRVLVNGKTGAVVGLAAWCSDPAGRDSVIVDVHCHPNVTDRAGDLLDALPLPSDTRQALVYIDATDEAKRHAVRSAGYEAVAELAGHCPADAQHSRMLDVTLWRKRF